MTAPSGPISVNFTQQGADPVITAVRELTAQIKQLRTAQDDTRRSGELLSKAQAGVRDVLVRLAQLLAVQRLAAFTKDTLDATVEIGRLAERTGIAVDTLSALRQVAENNGQTLQDLGTMFKFLSRSVTELESGSPAAVRAFASIRVSAKDLAGLSLDQSIERIAAAFAKLPDGPAKAAAAVQIFGKSGDEVLPILKQINAVGLEGLRAQAREIGALVTPEQVRQAREFNKSLNDLKDALQGIVRVTAGVLLPGVAQEINDIAKAIGQLSDANKRLLGVGTGVLAAALFGQAVGGPIGAGVGAAIAAVLLLIAKNASAAADQFERLSKADPVFLQASLDSKRAELAAAQTELEAAKRQAVGARGDRGDFLPRSFTEAAGRVQKLQADVATLEKALAARQQAGAARAPATAGGPSPVAPELLAARFAAIKAAADRELAYLKLTNSGKLADDQAAFDQGLISLRQFFADRRRLIGEETEKEVVALKAQQAELRQQQTQTVPGTPEAIKLGSAILDVKEKIKEADLRGAQQQAALDAEELQRVRQIGQERLGFEQKIFEAQGQTVEAALAGATIEVEQFRTFLAQLEPAQRVGLPTVEKFQALLVSQVRLTDLQQQATRALADLDRQRQAITNQVTVGTLTQLQGQEQIAALESGRLPVLRELAAAALAQAEALGDKTAIENAKQLSQEIDNLAASADLSGQRIAQLNEDLIGAGQSEVGNFFADLATNAENAGDVIRGFFTSLAGDIARAESQFVASELFRAIFGRGKGQGGGLQLGELAQTPISILGAPQDTAKIALLQGAAVTLSTAATTTGVSAGELDAAGGVVAAGAAGIRVGAGELAGAGNILLAAAAAIREAAAELAAAGAGSGLASAFSAGAAAFGGAAGGTEAGTGVLFAARGGIVPGYGTGDTVPAMLTPGEHVLTPPDARALARAGLLPIRGRSVLWNLRRFTPPQFFAAGGPVGGLPPLPAASVDARATIDGAIHVSHDEGLIVRVLRGTFLRIAAENRRELRDLTQGSGF